MQKCLSVFLLTCFLSMNGFAQELKHEKKEKKNLLTAALGYTYIPKGAALEAEEADGVFVPSIGLDYFRRIHPRWEIGVMTDIDLGEYVIFEKELNRKNALVVTAIIAFNLTRHLNLFAGGGMEFEQHHNLGVIRLGTEYAFKLKKEWVISPGFFFDFKEGIDTWSLSVSFGKEF